MLQERIVKIFYEYIGGEFTIHEIAKRLDVSYSYVYRQVELLVQQGIISLNVRGRRKYCKPNYGNPRVLSLFVKVSTEETESFLSDRDKLTSLVKELLSGIPQKANYNLLTIILYGSFAKEAQVDSSDLDLFFLVPSKEEYDEIVENECVSLSRRYGVELSPLVSEPQSFVNMLNESEHNVAKAILQNKVILYGAEKFWELVLGVMRKRI